MCYEVLITVSRGYPSVRGRLPTRYSPVRRSPYSRSIEISLKYFPLDLHVLGTPPAFILSQDQTLCKWYLRTLRFLNQVHPFMDYAFAFCLISQAFLFFRIILFWNCLYFRTMKFSRFRSAFYGAARALPVGGASNIIRPAFTLVNIFFSLFQVFLYLLIHWV